MNQSDLDMWWVDHVAEGDMGLQLPGGAALVNVHPPAACSGYGCPLHHPSDHALKDASLNWRQDRGLFERLCSHGIGHPDPDSIAYLRRSGSDEDGTHGCCGCCRSRDPGVQG